MDIFDLTGKIAIVTGGNQSIGFAISKGLAKAGATVVIANRRGLEGKKAADLLRGEGYNALAIQTDVSQKDSVAALVSNVMGDYGRIDILVNNAGVILNKPAEKVSRKDWDYIVDINLKGMFFCCQLVGKEMIKKRKGKIINVSSQLSQVVLNGRSVYAVSKAGVSHLTRALALEWSKYNINVNAIAPGPTLTELNRELFENHPEELAKRIDIIPMGRIGDSQDCEGAAVYLASDASNFVTGQILFVDGGYTII
jgi:NAD(P)-dependent dehydrogenase (short-subunit alcohol dehydrogenase family)